MTLKANLFFDCWANLIMNLVYFDFRNKTFLHFSFLSIVQHSFHPTKNYALPNSWHADGIYVGLVLTTTHKGRSAKRGFFSDE